MVTPEYVPAIGGVADYARQVAHGLATAGHEVHVWCPGARPDETDGAVAVHSTLGRIAGVDLQRTGMLLDRYPAPRRILVQWVPHGYGVRSMNVPFCVWLWRRAAKGDHIEVMVHEPYLAFWEGSWRQTAAAAVHRLMTAILLRAARRVWISIPAWESSWKPYALGRGVPFTWLPVPTPLCAANATHVCDIRERFDADRRPIVGHFGTFGFLIARQLNEILPLVLTSRSDVSVLLIGLGSIEYAATFLERHPQFEGRVNATGMLDAEGIATHVSACDVLVQPYPDGVSSRRTTTMAGLFLGVPVVTTRGHLTEDFWKEGAPVRLSRVGAWPALVGHVCELLNSPEERRRQSAEARRFYDQRFDVRHTIAALTGAA